MRFLRPDYNRPGPGVRADEPRKKGISRFFEVLTHNYGDLVKLNLLFCMCVLPSMALFVLGLLGFFPLIAMALSIFAAFPVGGALVASMFCITRILRDEPGYVWHDFKRKFQENRKQAAIPGILVAVFIYTQILLWGQMMAVDEAVLPVMIIFGIFALLLFLLIVPYVFLQIAYIDMKLYPVLKNSVLLAVFKFLRSLAGMVFGFLPWALIILYFPATLVIAPVILLFGFTVPWLMCLMWIWPPFDAQFEIEETLNKRKEDAC